MPRAKGTVPGKARRKKTLKARAAPSAGAAGSTRSPRRTSCAGLQYAYRDRRVSKRMMRRLWIQRINAAVRMYGLSYSQFIAGLKNSAIMIDRKQLSEMAIHDAEAFRKVVEEAKANLASPGLQPKNG